MTAIQDALPRVRAEIDQLDRSVVTLLAEREQLVRRAGRLKSDTAAVRAPARVEEVVSRVRTVAGEVGAAPEVVERTYRAMIAAFIDLELAALRTDHEAPGEQVVIEPARIEDAGELLTLQRAAYVTEARIYRDPELPPLVQTLDEFTDELRHATAFKATRGSRIVGAVRGKVEGDLLHIGRLTVAPDAQGRGLGTALLRTIEAATGPSVHRATLFTGHLSAANLRLYERLGYVEHRREELRPGVVLVHLLKHLDPCPRSGEPVDQRTSGSQAPRG